MKVHVFFVYINEHFINPVSSLGWARLLTKKEPIMPLYRVTIKKRINTNGIRLEPGMSVDVVSQSFSDPVHTNGGQSVADAFMRIYGIDIKKAGAMNSIYLEVKRIG